MTTKYQLIKSLTSYSNKLECTLRAHGKCTAIMMHKDSKRVRLIKLTIDSNWFLN